MTNSLILISKKNKGQIQNVQCLRKFCNRILKYLKRNNLDQKFKFNSWNLPQVLIQSPYSPHYSLFLNTLTFLLLSNKWCTPSPRVTHNLVPEKPRVMRPKNNAIHIILPSYVFYMHNYGRTNVGYVFMSKAYQRTVAASESSWEGHNGKKLLQMNYKSED